MVLDLSSYFLECFLISAKMKKLQEMYKQQQDVVFLFIHPAKDGIGGWQVAAVSNIRVHLVVSTEKTKMNKYVYAGGTLYFGLPIGSGISGRITHTEAAFIATDAVNRAEVDTVEEAIKVGDFNLELFFRKRINFYMMQSGGSAMQDVLRNISSKVIIHNADY